MSRTIVILILAGAVSPAAAQFDEIEPPVELAALDFMIGDWTVEGRFRNPDHIGTDRTLWYTLRDGGVTRFDGRAWTAFSPGDPTADSVHGRIERRPEPYVFSNPLEVRRAQDDFILIADDGRTSGTALIYFDTATREWISTSFHAPTNAIVTVRAPWNETGPIFDGRGTDRRGERLIRRRYVIHDRDWYTIRTDISFDDGASWIDDQIVQEVRRR